MYFILQDCAKGKDVFESRLSVFLLLTEADFPSYTVLLKSFCYLVQMNIVFYMIRAVLFLIGFVISGTVLSQNSFKGSIKDSSNHEPLSGVSVSIKNNSSKGTITDASGFFQLKNLSPKGTILVFSMVGYKTLEQAITFPDTVSHIIYLSPDAEALNTVVVLSTTRGNERIENATTKVEVLGQEEMNEESTLKPGNIASILGDVSGVQIQQSSVTSGNANIRIQGLDGRYTQILRDGMPLYGGYSGGFGILTIPPLDLKQVELIKGSSSTLYGGGAIGGLVNLISKKPSLHPDASFLINQTTLKETNVNAYYAQRGKKFGITFFAGQTIQKPVDVDKDGFTDLPDQQSTLIHPVLFFYPSSKSFVSLGWSGSFEKRNGGDLLAVKNGSSASHPFFEKNQLGRNSYTLLSETRFEKGLSITVKGSLSDFKRKETTNTYLFEASQQNYYSEISIVKKAHQHIVVAGINLTGENFRPSDKTPVPIGKFSQSVIGLFLQDSWQLLENTKLETGIRYDHQNTYGNFILPRIAVFQRFNEHWGSRIGFGMGYVPPNPLTPQLRDYSIFQLQPLATTVKAEKSYSGNAELNFKTDVGEEGEFFINQAFFITKIGDALVGEENGSGNIEFSNKAKGLLTSGSDTYIQLHIPHWEFYIGYTYTEALRKYLSSNQFLPVTPRHRAASTVLYEQDGNFRIGIEASYNGSQYRENYSKTPGFLFMAAMAEKKFGPKWSLVLNCENLLDERQSKYESLYTGSVTDPVFKTLWAPIDGRAVNLCLRFQPFAE